MTNTMDEWLARLRSLGYPNPAVIGVGMEGIVVRLEPGRVAKVWHNKTTREMQRLEAFYRDVASAGLPFATPRIDDVMTIADTVVSIEPELTGSPLDDGNDEHAERHLVTTRQVAALTGVLADASRNLPVLGSGAALWDGAADTAGCWATRSWSSCTLDARPARSTPPPR